MDGGKRRIYPAEEKEKKERKLPHSAGERGSFYLTFDI